MILGMTLHPGEECTRRVEGTEHLIIAALDCRPGKYSDDLHLSSCLLIKHGEYEQVLCTLEKGNVTQQKLDLVLLKNEVITFTVEGTGTIYITGYTTSNTITFDGESYEVDNAKTGPPAEEVPPVDTRSNDVVVLLDDVVGGTEPNTEESSEDGPLQSLLKESVDVSKKQSFMESMMLMNNGIQQSEDVSRTGDRLPQPQCETSREHRKAKKRRKRKSPVKAELRCAFCGKPFPTRYSVMRHERGHRGDKPFSCRLCSVAYSDKSTLRKHILKKHDRPPQHPRRPRTCREARNLHETQQGSVRLAGGRTTDREETLREGPREAEASGLRSSVRNTGQSGIGTGTRQGFGRWSGDCTTDQGDKPSREEHTITKASGLRSSVRNTGQSGIRTGTQQGFGRWSGDCTTDQGDKPSREEHTITKASGLRASIRNTGPPGIESSSLKKKPTDQEENCLGVSSGLEGLLEEEGHDLEAQGQAFHRDVRRQAAWEGTTELMSLSNVEPDSQILSPPASSLAEESTTGDSEATILVDSDMVSLDNEDSMKTHRHQTPSSIRCEECGKGFSSRFTLRRHQYRHTGEQPYQCGLCDRRFNRLDKKKAHENRHCDKANTMSSVDPQQRGLPQQLCESSETTGTVEQGNPQRISSTEKTSSMGRRSSHRNAKRLGNRATPIREELVVHTGDCSQLSSEQEGSPMDGGRAGLEEFSARTPHRNLRGQSELERYEEERTLGNREGSGRMNSQAQMLEGVVPTAVSKEAAMEGVSLKDCRVEVGLGIHEVEGKAEGQKMKPTQPVKSKPGLGIASVNQPRVGKRVGRMKKSVVDESRWCCTVCSLSFRTRDFLRAHRRKHVT